MEATPVVVIGMHRSGTSLVSHVLHQLGIYMGEDFLSPDEGNEGGYWEDTEWLGINKRILSLAGGSWDKVPMREKILSRRPAVDGLIKQAIAKRRDKEVWGFKDPRTCLTAELICRPYMPHAKYIVVKRPRTYIIKSLVKLRGVGQWSPLVAAYQERIDQFVDGIPSTQVAYIHYQDLTTESLALSSLYWLAGWLNITRNDMTDVMDIIKFRS